MSNKSSFPFSLRVDVEAYDMDRVNPRRGVTQLVIYITDVNDNAPKLDIKFIVQGYQDTSECGIIRDSFEL